MPADMSRQHSARRSLSTALVLFVAAATLAGCAVGKRPTLVEQPRLEDEAATAVIDLLEQAASATFTATYDITPSLTGAVTKATVVQSDSRQRITIGDVDYFSDGPRNRTCVAGTGECVDGIDDARVSDLSITHVFWSESAVGRLGNDASRAVGPSTARTDTIANRPATCVDLPMPTADGNVGSVVYCAIDAGVLGRYAGADVAIELTSFTATADESQLSG